MAPCRALGRLLTLIALVLSFALPALATDAPTHEEVQFRNLLRLLQAESPSLDQAFVLDTSGSVQPSLTVARKMMSEFVQDLARDGDRLVVVAVGAGSRVLVDEVIGKHNRTRLLARVRDPGLMELGGAFAQFTDLDASRYELLSRFDRYNEALIRSGQAPHRQLIYTFSDFKKEPPPDSPFVSATSPKAIDLAHLEKRLSQLKTKSAHEIENEFNVDFRGVPLRIEQSEFAIPLAGDGSRPATSFEAYLSKLASEFRPRRDVQEPHHEYDQAISRLQGLLAKRLFLSKPENFKVASDGKGLIGTVTLTDGLVRTAIEGAGLATGSEQIDVQLPSETANVSPGEALAFDVRFPGLKAPDWWEREPAIYASQSLLVQPVGIVKLVDGPAFSAPLSDMIPLQELTFDVAVAPQTPPYWLFALGLLVLALLGVLMARQLMGPAQLLVTLDVNDAGESTRREFKLGRGESRMVGGKGHAGIPIQGVEEELFRLARKGLTLVAEGKAVKLLVKVDAQSLEAGKSTPLKERGRITIAATRHDPSPLAEIRYQVGQSGPAPTKKPGTGKLSPQALDDESYPSRGPRRF